MKSGVPPIMQRVSGVINVGGKFVHVVADNINSRFIRVGDEIESGTVMVNFLLSYVLCFMFYLL